MNCFKNSYSDNVCFNNNNNNNNEEEEEKEEGGGGDDDDDDDDIVTNCYVRHTHVYAEPSQYIGKTHGCYLVTLKLQFTLRIISLQIRRHRMVINTVFKHHPLFGIYKIKI